MAKARLAIDIGGTFTDLALIADDGRYSAKVLTTSQAPEEGVLAGIDQLLRRAELTAEDIGLVIHGTTLATNAIIERKGVKTALIVTEVVPRLDRDGVRQPLRAVRHLHGQACATRASRSAAPRARAPRRPWHRAGSSG